MCKTVCCEYIMAAVQRDTGKGQGVGLLREEGRWGRAGGGLCTQNQHNERNETGNAVEVSRRGAGRFDVCAKGVPVSY